LERFDIIPLRGRLILACSLSDVRADPREPGRLLAARLIAALASVFASLAELVSRR
jgi:hypothetical protein